MTGWRGPYPISDDRRFKADPWGRPYVYRRVEGNGGGYLVLSFGPDGKEGTADDIKVGGHWADGVRKQRTVWIILDDDSA